jgi:rubredoxin
MPAIGCKNCGGHFTPDEVMHSKRPMHPWPLTSVGQRVLEENAARGDDQWACPMCGQKTLRA